MKHTKGPWVVGREKVGDYISIEHSHPREVGAISLTIANVVARQTWKAEAEANAYLIAASPDLLAALEDMVAILPANRRNGGSYENAVKVIAKAKGQGGE